MVEISLVGGDASALHACANSAFDTISRIHDLMSFHSADSDVSRLNNNAFGEAVKVDPRTWHVIQRACEISQASDGVFDITVGGAMMARGELPLVSQRTVDRSASFRDIELLADSHVCIRRPLAIDVGGIAKGYAVDCAVAVLREMGVAAGCVNAGGDLRAFGDETVPVDVRDPHDPAIAGAQVMLRERAFATSAHYASDRNFNSAGVVLDPRDDTLATRSSSASVRAASCMIADALAKCVLVLGRDSGPLLQHYEADGFLLGRDEGSILINAYTPDSDSKGPEIDGRGLAESKPVCRGPDAQLTGAVL